MVVIEQSGNDLILFSTAPIDMESSPTVVYIVVGVFGALVACALALLAVICFVKRRKGKGREHNEGEQNSVPLSHAVAGSEYASLPRSTMSEQQVQAPLVYAQLVKSPAPSQQDDYGEVSLRPNGGQTTLSEVPFSTGSSYEVSYS